MENIEKGIADNISIPSGFELKRIDRNLDLNLYTNKDFLTNEISGFWGSLDRFFHKGVGYCTVSGDVIAGLGYTGYIAGDVYTIGIITNEQFRRIGLAEAAVRAILKEYSAMGVRPYWDCMEENIASYSLARKVGFKKRYEYSVYWFYF
ncbi:MAG: GNAT family N-acetyltransferase [Clostridiaceae bacterium]